MSRRRLFDPIAFYATSRGEEDVVRIPMKNNSANWSTKLSSQSFNSALLFLATSAVFLMILLPLGVYDDRRTGSTAFFAVVSEA